MDCTECGNDIVLVKKSKVHYDGVRVENVYLRNCEVEVCRHCGIESPVVRKIKKVHLMIAFGIATAPSKLTGDEVRFLRKAMRITIADWAARIGIAEGTFSRWENGRSPAAQVEKLARVDFLLRMFSELPSDVDLPDAISDIIGAELTEKRDFAIVLDIENLDGHPHYESLGSVDIAQPSFAYIEAGMLDLTRLATVSLFSLSQKAAPGRLPLVNSGEICNAGDTFQIAA